MIWFKVIALVSIDMVSMLILDEVWHSGTASRGSWRHLQHQQWTDVQALERPALLHSSPNHEPWLQRTQRDWWQQLKPKSGREQCIWPFWLSQRTRCKGTRSPKAGSFFSDCTMKYPTTDYVSAARKLRCDGNSGLHVCKHAIAAIIALVLPEKLLALL